MNSERFPVNPFGELSLTAEDRSQLIAIAESLVLAQFEQYEEHLNNKKHIDPTRWKKYSSSGAVTMYIERKKANPESKLPELVMVGALPGSLHDNMFGLTCPTIESMRIKSSYLNDISAAVVIVTIVEPTVDEPFRSVVVKWMEIDIPGASIGLVRNRDYVYLESTGILQLKNGQEVGYHLLHSVSFPQVHELPNRVRGNMSLCAIFHQEGPDKTDCRGLGVMDPGGDMIRVVAVMGMVQATMAGLKYSYCGQMKKLAWLLEQKHAEFRRKGVPKTGSDCVTCSKLVKASRFGRSSSSCKLCFGTLCGSCKVPKKLSFITLDMELSQRKLSFCAKCLLEATKMDALEAARQQLLGKDPVQMNTYRGIYLNSEVSSSSDGTAVGSSYEISSCLE